MTDLYLKQGLATKRVIQKRDSTGAFINWSAYTAAMQVRDFSGALLLDMNTENGGIEISDTKVTLAFSHVNMAGLSIPAGVRLVESPDCLWVALMGRYDIIMTASLDERVLEAGDFYLSPRITTT